MYSIGEFSKISGLTIKTLRFYHERGILEPAVIDQGTGYRYYDKRCLNTASVIRTLRELEFSLGDIATMLSECSDDQDALEFLEQHKEELTRKLGHYQTLIHRIDGVIAREREVRESIQMQKEPFSIEERDLEPIVVAGLRMKGKYSDCGQGFSKLAKQVGRYIAGKSLCLYYDGEYREEDADFEPCFPLRKHVEVDGVDVRTLPAQRCVTLLHRGPYDTIGRSYARVLEYMKQQGYDIELPTREVYLKGPGMIFRGNPKKYLTEIQVPIKA